VIDLSENTYVECIWFVNLGTQDYMACLFREGEGRWLVKYRFREHRDRRLFDSEDERAWYRVTPRKGVPPEQAQRELFEMINTTTSELAKRCEARLELVMVRGDGEAAFRAIAAQPWGHARWDGRGEV
jgi:hypothetical protein